MPELATTVALKRSSLEAIHAHARSTYPEECCGLIIECDGIEQVVQASNMQNELHAEDPERFPRSAAVAFTMGPEAAPALIACERGELRLLAIYHSHPQCGAYFSAEDRRNACGAKGDPIYPQAAQIVMSVREGVIEATKAFVWNAESRDFVEAEICAS